MTSLLLTLHLLGSPLPTPPGLGLITPPGIVRTSLNLGLFPRPTAPEREVPMRAAAVWPSSSLVFLLELGAGATAMVSSDAVTIGLELAAIQLGIGGICGGCQSRRFSTAFNGAWTLLLLAPGISFVTTPFLLAGTEFGLSRAFGAPGGGFWLSVATSIVGELLLYAGAAAAASLKPTAGPAMTAVDVGLLVAQVVGLPLAASLAFRSRPAEIPVGTPVPWDALPSRYAGPELGPTDGTAGAASPPGLRLFPLFATTFG